MKRTKRRNPRYLGAIIRKKTEGRYKIYTVYLPEDRGRVSYRTDSLTEAKAWVKRNKGVPGHGRNPVKRRRTKRSTNPRQLLFANKTAAAKYAKAHGLKRSDYRLKKLKPKK